MSYSHLAIDLNRIAVHFSSLQDGVCIEQKKYAFVDQQEHRFKVELERFWNDTKWDFSAFDEVTLSWSDRYTTIVPTNVFNESNKRAIFSLSFGVDTSLGEIDYNRISLPNLVNVYAIPLWVKSFFVLRCPKIIIQHEGTHLLRGLFSRTDKKTATQLVLHHEHFLMASIYKSDLIFYSSFDWQDERDVAYYYSFFLAQYPHMDDRHVLEICSGAGSQMNIELLISLLQSIHKEKISVQYIEHLIDKYQLLCV